MATLNEANTSAANEQDTPPDWFLRQRSRSAASNTSDPEPVVPQPAPRPDPRTTRLPPAPVPGSAGRPLAVTVHTETAAETEPAQLSFWQNVNRPETWHSITLSATIHLATALLLSFIYFAIPENRAGLQTLWMNPGEHSELEILTDGLPLDVSGGSESAPVEQTLSASDVLNLQSDFNLTSDLQLAINSTGSGSGTGEGSGSGADLHNGFQMPAGGKTVKKGSFTVWTVPNDPKPGEDYRIVIQVKYPKASQKLRPGDITGIVVGTDQYRKVIGISTAQYLVEAKQVVVDIPGADARVRDTIRVYSQILKETQLLEIVF